MARKGKPIPRLLDEMNGNAYYRRAIPKSLGNEYVRDSFIKILAEEQSAIEDLLYTAAKHIAVQIAQAFGVKKNQRVLITGGGAHNKFLIELIKEASPQQFIIPDRELVDFKEAMIFAFMGVLRNVGQVNCLASYTGASQDLSTGNIFLP
jgi:anhydro-N-acetylmuramic acid kinase